MLRRGELKPAKAFWDPLPSVFAFLTHTEMGCLHLAARVLHARVQRYYDTASILRIRPGRASRSAKGTPSHAKDIETHALRLAGRKCRMIRSIVIISATPPAWPIGVAAAESAPFFLRWL